MLSVDIAAPGERIVPTTRGSAYRTRRAAALRHRPLTVMQLRLGSLALPFVRDLPARSVALA